MIRVSIVTRNLDTETRREKALKAGKILEEIANHPRFKELILAMPDKWRRGETSFFKNLSNEQIYNYIMSGKEEWNGEEDRELDLEVHDYRSSWVNRNVIGYMNPGKKPIWVNTRHFDTASIKRVTSNFFHEYGHTLGMRHSGPNFRLSIPYYLNDVVEELYQEVAGLPDVEKPKYKRVCRRLWYTLWIKKRCRMVLVNKGDIVSPVQLGD